MAVAHSGPLRVVKMVPFSESWMCLDANHMQTPTNDNTWEAYRNGVSSNEGFGQAPLRLEMSGSMKDGFGKPPLPLDLRSTLMGGACERPGRREQHIILPTTTDSSQGLITDGASLRYAIDNNLYYEEIRTSNGVYLKAAFDNNLHDGQRFEITTKKPHEVNAVISSDREYFAAFDNLESATGRISTPICRVPTSEEFTVDGGLVPVFQSQEKRGLPTLRNDHVERGGKTAERRNQGFRGEIGCDYSKFNFQ